MYAGCDTYNLSITLKYQSTFHDVLSDDICCKSPIDIEQSVSAKLTLNSWISVKLCRKKYVKVRALSSHSFVSEFFRNILYSQFTATEAITLQRHHNERNAVSNHQPHDCLLNRLFRRRSKKISMLRGTGLCEGNSSETGEFPVQMASNAENASIWWHHHDTIVPVPARQPWRI